MTKVEFRAFHAAWSRPQISDIAARALNATIPPGCWVAVIGPNGAGKSTLLKGMAGLTPFVGGDLLIEKKSIRNLTDRYRAGVLLVSQGGPWRRGSLTLEEARDLAWALRPGLANDSAFSALVAEITKWCWVTANKVPPRLFDLIAAILAIPSVLLLDEILPAFADGLRSRQRYQEIKDLLPGVTCFFIDHNIRHVTEFADYVIELSDDEPPRLVDLTCEGVQRELEGQYGVAELSTGDEEETGEEWLHSVRFDRPVREQVRLAMHAALGSRGEWQKLYREILNHLPFLETSRNADVLSGGQQTVLTFLLSTFGMGAKIPQSSLMHLDAKHRAKLDWLGERRCQMLQDNKRQAP